MQRFFPKDAGQLARKAGGSLPIEILMNGVPGDLPLGQNDQETIGRSMAGTPKDRVAILQEAFRKTYQDPEFFKEYKKLTGDEPTPLLPDAHEKAVREIPREVEVIAVFKKLVGAGLLPPR